MTLKISKNRALMGPGLQAIQDYSLSKKLATFCPCLRILNGNKLETNELVYLMEGILKIG